MQRYIAIDASFCCRSQSLRGEEENRVPSGPGKSTLVQVLISALDAPDPGYSDLLSAVMRSSPCRCISAVTGVHAMSFLWIAYYNKAAMLSAVTSNLGQSWNRLGPRGEYP